MVLQVQFSEDPVQVITIESALAVEDVDGIHFLSKEERSKLPEATMVMRKAKGGDVTPQIAGLVPRLPDMSHFDGTATMKMPEVRRFKQKFSSEVLTTAFWGANLLVGTTNGLFLLDRSGGGEIYTLVKGRKFRQLDLVESLGIVVCINGKKDKVRSQCAHYPLCSHSVRSQLRMYNLEWLKSRVVPTKKELPKPFQPIHDLVHVHAFQIGQWLA